MNRALAAVLVLAFALASSAFADDLPADLKARRARVTAALDGATMLVAWSAPPKVYSRDVELRVPPGQQPAVPDGHHAGEHDPRADAGQREEARDPVHRRADAAPGALDRSHADQGRRPQAASGIETVYFTSQFEPFVTAMFNGEAVRLRAEPRTTPSSTASSPRSATAPPRCRCCSDDDLRRAHRSRRPTSSPGRPASASSA